MAKETLGYEFAPTGGGDETGLNDAVTTTFNTNIPSAIARESIQNIIDASIDVSGKSKVFADFSLIKIKPSDIPNTEQLREILVACKEYVKHVPKGKKFFNEALNLISGSAQINILRIGDWGTVGLSGDDEDTGGNYYNFLKSVGASAKSGSEGGSFGLGKGSFYAASAFRTIFVSSIYAGDKHVFMGKSRLVSHKVSGTIKQGNGSFGLPGQKPVRNPILIPALFKKDRQGTDVNILGFLDDANWKEDIIKSVLSNFWLAILKDKLEITVSGEKINAATINELIYKYFPDTDPNSFEDEGPVPYFEAYTKKESLVFEKDLPTLGKVSLYILTREKLPKKVAYFRKTGMLIKNAGHRSIVSYVGVFVCENDTGNDILRRMEPPAHNDWTKDSPNAKTEDGKPLPEAVDAENELKRFIRESLKSLVKSESTENLSIPGLSKYLYLPGDELSETASLGEAGNEEKSTSSAIETAIEVGAASPQNTPEISKPVKIEVISKFDEGRKGEGQDVSGTGKGRKGRVGGGGGGGRHEEEGGPAEAGEGEERVKTLTNMQYRSFANIKDNGSFEHVLILRGDPNIKCDLFLEAGTDDAFDEVSIKEAIDDSGVPCLTQKNYIRGIVLDSEGEKRIKIIFDSLERYSLRLVAYESK